MATTPDTYSAAEAAKILGVSERRVRQLVAQGTLSGSRGTDGTVRIGQQAVNEERKRRRKAADNRTARVPAGRTSRRSSTRAPAAEPLDMDSLAEAVATAVGQKLEGQLEITRRAESLVRQELDQERAWRVQLEAQLRTAEERVNELQQRQLLQPPQQAEAPRRKGLFRRS